MTDTSWIQFVKKYGSWMKGMSILIKEIIKITWEKNPRELKAMLPASIRQEMFTAKSWNGCENNRGPEQRKAKAGRTAFMRCRTGRASELKTCKCSCKQK